MLDQLPHALGFNISVETVSHLVSIITGALICYLLIVEPHGFARLWALAKEKMELMALSILIRIRPAGEGRCTAVRSGGAGPKVVQARACLTGSPGGNK